MSNSESQNRVNESAITEIEELIVGSGASNFRELEKMVDVFCPFEAIGMVRQEIKHSNFLSYILDPNRPHVFGDKFLNEFLSIIVEESASIELKFSRLDLHFMDFSNARILREWRHIDILIELPKTTRMQKGIVIAVELKIDANESATQLRDYSKIIDDTYPKNKWDHAFVYLTKDNSDPSNENKIAWIPVGLSTVIKRLIEIQDANKFIGQSADLFTAYTEMMKRHILENKRLKELVSKLWIEHKEALDAIYDHKPDLRGDILNNLSNDEFLAEKLSKGTQFHLTKDKSSRSYLRFVVKEWEDIAAMQRGDKTWLNTNDLLALELHGSAGLNFRISYVVGPGDSDIRQNLYSRILLAAEKNELSVRRKKKEVSEKWQHLSSCLIYSDGELETLDSEDTPENITNLIINSACEFLKKTLPIYDKIIREEFDSSNI